MTERQISITTNEVASPYPTHESFTTAMAYHAREGISPDELVESLQNNGVSAVKVEEDLVAASVASKPIPVSAEGIFNGFDILIGGNWMAEIKFNKDNKPIITARKGIIAP